MSDLAVAQSGSLRGDLAVDLPEKVADRPSSSLHPLHPCPRLTALPRVNAGADSRSSCCERPSNGGAEALSLPAKVVVDGVMDGDTFFAAVGRLT